MRVVWESSIYGSTAPIPCILCGHRYHPLRVRGHFYMLAVVYNDQGRVIGESCRDCVQAGPTEIRAQLTEQLQTLERQVQELQALTQEEIYLPSLEDEFQVYS